MIIDEIINEFRNKNKIFQQTNIKWGSDDRTKQAFHINDKYEELFDVEFADNNKFKEEILKHKENFYIEECYQVYPYNTEEELKNFYPIEEKNVKEFCNKFDSIAKYWSISIDIDKIEYNSGWQFLEFASYGLTDYAIEQLKEESKEMNNMFEDLIARVRVYKAKSDKLYHHRPYELKLISDKTEVFKNVNQDNDRNNISKANFIFKGLADNGVNEDRYDGSESNYSNIKSIEAIQLVNKDLHITYHNLQYEPKYRGRDGWEICGIDLTRVIMYKFILTNNTIIRFDFQGMIDNEKDTQGIYFHNIIDKNAEANEKYKKEQKTKKLLEEILKESDKTIETSGNPIIKNPQDKEWEEIGLKPRGDFAYVVEFFSFSLVMKENYDAVYGDANSEYIEDAYALIKEVEQRAEKLRKKYSNKGVKVTVNGFNNGCEGGLAVYVWIPYQ